jgi:putative ABC transport system permease protein
MLLMRQPGIPFAPVEDFMDLLRQDLQYALRRLIQSPGFTLVAVVTLALGIGANTAIFSVVRGVLLKPLPFPESDRLVAVFHAYDGDKHAVMSGPNFIDVAHTAKSLENAAAIETQRVILTGQGDPVRLNAAAVSASFFDVLRVRPELGRTFAADESTPGRTDLIVLSHGLWQQRFGGDTGVIGRKIQIDGVDKEIIGVMPAGFNYPDERVAWLPIAYDQGFVSTQRGAWYLFVIARLNPGVTPAQSAAEVKSIAANLARLYPDADGSISMTTVPLLEATVGDVRPSMLVLLGAVGFVLLIACANVANLLLARAAARETEMAVRTALGAGRGRLLRQLLTESMALSLVGAGMGLLLAVWGVAFLVQLKPDGIPRLDDVHVDAVVVLFTIGVAVLTGLLFGVAPALHATRGTAAASLKEGGRGAVGARGGARTRGALVVAELALALMLLVGAGLLMRSFARLQAVDPGLRPDHTLTFELTFPDARYGSDHEDRLVAFFDQLLPRLRALPGVTSAGAVMGLPLSGLQFDISFEVLGRPPVAPQDQPSMQIRVATPSYFSTVGIPLERGRFFSDDDRAGSKPVVLITQSAARQYFPNEDPIGKTIRLGWGKRVHGQVVRGGGEVVGIVGDVKEFGLSEASAPQLYMPLRQWPVGRMAVAMRTSTPPMSLADAAKAQVLAIDPSLPVSSVRTMDEIVARSISQPRFYLLLLSVFAAVALILAAVGIFGVLSYAVAQRTREIGIRMALGAPERSVLRLVVGQAMLLVLAGIGIGAALAVVLSRGLTTMLFSVSATDPATFAAVAGILCAVSLVASYVPARRATRVDPIVALRSE